MVNWSTNKFEKLWHCHLLGRRISLLNDPALTIAQSLNLPEPTIQSALDLLKRHDVAENDNGNWRIAIELFRRWLLQENVQRD